MSKLTIFAASLIVALAAFSAHAQQPGFDLSTPNGYCNFLAGYAEAAAKDRDAGTPLYKSIQLASGIKHEVIRGDVLWVIQYVYAPANLPPNQAAGGIFQLCWNVYGE